MEFLKPFMKNRNTLGNPTSPLEESQLATLPCEESQLEEFDIPPSDEPRIEATNDGEPTEPSENVARLQIKYQREVRRNLFQAVSDAEDKAEDEITDKCEVDQTYLVNTQRAISITPQPTSSLSRSLTQGFPEFFSASNSTSISSVDTNERNCSRHEDDSSRTFLNCYNMV
ncbi:hypothetical protein ACI65C_003979 [Semiaphis heraclei]